MNYIIKNATLVDATSEFNNKKVNIVIESGIIKNITTETVNTQNYEVIEKDNLCVSAGWMDSSVSFGEPGFEDRETIENGLLVAASNGFTHVAINPNNQPITDNITAVKYLLLQSIDAATTLLPIGALTKQEEGKDLAEMYDMQNAGAIAFGDYKKSLENANLLKIGLQYAQDFDATIITYCMDATIKGKGVVHEGIEATKLGLKGIPALAEEVVLARNLFLLEYTGGKIHIPTISTKESVRLIKEAKAKGLNVTCSVAVHNLVFTDKTLNEFDTRYKVLPPLRDESHRQALIAGVLEGTIDCITSDHYPLDIEHKKMEFDAAKNGTIGLETAFGALLTVLPKEIIVEKLTAAKRIFNTGSTSIEKEKTASLTLFTTEGSTVFTKEMIQSKSKNSAFLGFELKGKVYGTYNNGKLTLNK